MLQLVRILVEVRITLKNNYSHFLLDKESLDWIKKKYSQATSSLLFRLNYHI